MSRPALSIAICTFNRAELLRGALQSLEAQNIDRGCEIIVVDNNSTDHTREVVESFSGLPVRYVFEDQQGLSHARNRALVEFRGDHLLFLDDDIRLAPNCVERYRNAIAAFAEFDFFGGRILPDWQGAAPHWASPLPLIDGLLVWLDLGESVAPFTSNENPFGASFAVSRRLINDVGAFTTRLGCVGTRRGRGEETEWFARARKSRARGLYVGDAVCTHLVDPQRLGLRQLFDYGVESGAAHRIIAGATGRGSLRRLSTFAVRGAAQLLRGRGDRFRQCVINMGIEYDALRH